MSLALRTVLSCLGTCSSSCSRASWPAAMVETHYPKEGNGLRSLAPLTSLVMKSIQRIIKKRYHQGKRLTDETTAVCVPCGIHCRHHARLLFQTSPWHSILCRHVFSLRNSPPSRWLTDPVCNKLSHQWVKERADQHLLQLPTHFNWFPAVMCPLTLALYLKHIQQKRSHSQSSQSHSWALHEFVEWCDIYCLEQGQWDCSDLLWQAKVTGCSSVNHYPLEACRDCWGILKVPGNNHE